MRASLAIAVAVTLLAATGAQTAPTADKPDDPGNTVSGITVTPRLKKACAARDPECVALVVAELKRLYPERLKQFCFQEQTKAARTQFTGDQLYDALALSGQHNGPPTPTAFPISAALKTACATDKK